MEFIMCMSIENRSTKFNATSIKNEELRKYANELAQDAMNIRANLLHMSAIMASIASKRDTGILDEFDGSIATFAETRLGIKKSQAYSMVEVGVTFLDEKGNSKLPQSGGKWNNTQLMALLPMGGTGKNKKGATETLQACKKLVADKKIKPSMTVAEIKMVVREERPDAKKLDEKQAKAEKKQEEKAKAEKKSIAIQGKKLMSIEFYEVEGKTHILFDGKEMNFTDKNILEIINQMKQATNYVALEQ